MQNTLCHLVDEHADMSEKVEEKHFIMQPGCSKNDAETGLHDICEPVGQVEVGCFVCVSVADTWATVRRQLESLSNVAQMMSIHNNIKQPLPLKFMVQLPAHFPAYFCEGRHSLYFIGVVRLKLNPKSKRSVISCTDPECAFRNSKLDITVCPHITMRVSVL
jgi:hypothetical protein